MKLTIGKSQSLIYEVHKTGQKDSFYSLLRMKGRDDHIEVPIGWRHTVLENGKKVLVEYKALFLPDQRIELGYGKQIARGDETIDAVLDQESAITAMLTDKFAGKQERLRSASEACTRCNDR